MQFSMKNLHDWVEQALRPSFLEIIDESHLHSGHVGVRNIDAEITHILVRINSDQLKGLTKVEQHRRLYDVLRPAIDAGLHSLRFELLGA